MAETQFIPAWAVALIALGTPISGVVLFVFGRGSKSGEDRATLSSRGQRLTALEVTQNSSVVTVSNHTQLLQLMANENEKRDRKVEEISTGIATLLEADEGQMRDNIPKNYDLTALCLWREARGEGHDGMHAVANVIVNRANKYKTTCDVQVMRPMQFSSMTAPDDKQLFLFPNGSDGTWQQAQVLARAAKASSLADITNGSTLYFAPKSMTARDISPHTITINGVERIFPKGWDRTKVKFQAEIGRQLFFTEVA